MSAQDNALRLADLLETTARPGGLAQEAANELRRLDSLNAELLAALTSLVNVFSIDSKEPEIVAARAAIAKAVQP